MSVLVEVDLWGHDPVDSTGWAPNRSGHSDDKKFHNLHISLNIVKWLHAAESSWQAGRVSAKQIRRILWLRVRTAIILRSWVQNSLEACMSAFLCFLCRSIPHLKIPKDCKQGSRYARYFKETMSSVLRLQRDLWRLERCLVRTSKSESSRSSCPALTK